jgi:hypothetical protein
VGTLTINAPPRERLRTRHSAQRPSHEAEVARAAYPSTLEETLARAWEDLASEGRAECLVCDGALEAAPPFASPPARGECRRCGSSLD